MEIEQVLLTIEGEPGEGVRVLYRNHSDEPPPPIYIGNLGPDGRVTISVPHAYLVVHGHSRMVILRLHETKAITETVRLIDAKP